VLAIPAGIALGCSNFFLNHGASVWVRSNDAVFDMEDRNCDVLIYGDSTAMTGINPEIVESRTGQKTCNISVTNAVLAVTGNLTLDHFLRHNGRPRVLLIQLSPDDFQLQQTSWHDTIYAEGLLELMRHGDRKQTRTLLLQHPHEAIAFAGYAAGYSAFYGLKQVWFHLTHQRPAEDRMAVRNGFFTPPAPARTSCDTAAATTEPAPSEGPRSLVESYRSGYASSSELVLVNVAPIPSCDPNLTAFTTELDGLTSNNLLPLPIGMFNDSRHYTETGSEVVSRLISDEVNAVTEDHAFANRQIPEPTLSLRLRHVTVRRP
jgi:hypothetical protein